MVELEDVLRRDPKHRRELPLRPNAGVPASYTCKGRVAALQQ